MADHELSIESFTVSYAMDIYRNGEKRSSFVSTTIRATPPIALSDFQFVRLDASFMVAKAAITDALTRMDITEEDANVRIISIKENTEAIKSAILRKRQVKETE